MGGETRGSCSSRKYRSITIRSRSSTLLLLHLTLVAAFLGGPPQRCAGGFAVVPSRVRSPVPSTTRARRRENSFEGDYEQDESYYEAPSKKRSPASTRPYWEVDLEDEWQDDEQSYSTPSTVLEKDVVEWEKCTTSAGTAWVLLPPPTVEKPTAVLHFVGGTFFGSAPNIWYRTLLEDIVLHTSCAVVATSIPVTVTRSPLDHVRLASQLREQFCAAYRDVLTDEYGTAALMQSEVPVCGLGHSLGARLLTVLATLGGGNSDDDDNNNKRPGGSSSHGTPQPPPYKSFILISFTNYGAAAGIPGIAQLYRRSRMVEQRQQQGEPKTRRLDDDWEDADDEDDSDLGELWQELTGAVRAGTSRVQHALTPSSASLEFHPTPEQLWKAVKEDGRYAVPQTLVVQFDDDQVDQSSLLAAAIVGSSDVKFARLRGTHLTPVSAAAAAATDSGSSGEATTKKEKWLQRVNGRAGRMLLAALQGRRPRHQSSSRPGDAEALLELRQSIARYITDVVTKE